MDPATVGRYLAKNGQFLCDAMWGRRDFDETIRRRPCPPTPARRGVGHLFRVEAPRAGHEPPGDAGGAAARADKPGTGLGLDRRSRLPAPGLLQHDEADPAPEAEGEGPCAPLLLARAVASDACARRRAKQETRGRAPWAYQDCFIPSYAFLRSPFSAVLPSPPPLARWCPSPQ
eukprot:1930878-Pyramimonas_sp.AAC.1